VEKCCTEFPALRNETSQKSNGNGQKPTEQRKHCKFCEKDGQTEEKCFALEKS
jgi:hypothetical protein